jgi:hypothetical protein
MAHESGLALTATAFIEAEQGVVQAVRLASAFAATQRERVEVLAFRARHVVLGQQDVAKRLAHIRVIRVILHDHAPERLRFEGRRRGIGELCQGVGGHLVDVGFRVIRAQVPLPRPGTQGKEALHHRPPGFYGAGMIAPLPMHIGGKIGAVAEPGRGLACPAEEVERPLVVSLCSCQSLSSASCSSVS